MLCLPFREQTEVGTLWSLLSTVGSPPRPEPVVSHARAPGSPEVLPPAGPLVSRALEGQGREAFVSKPSVRIAIVDRRQHSTARTQNPLQPSFFIFFPVAFWESTSWLFPVIVHDQESWEEGLAPVFPD